MYGEKIRQGLKWVEIKTMLLKPKYKRAMVSKERHKMGCHKIIEKLFLRENAARPID